MIRKGEKMNFENAHKLVGIAEGGYVNDPKDNGGETIFGISRKFNPQFSGWKDIDLWKSRGNTEPSALTKIAKGDKYFMDRVAAFYRGLYWNKCQCESLHNLIRYPVYSCAVNCGVKIASIFLQRAVGAKDDGIIGRKSLIALSDFPPQEILKSFYQQWDKYYDRIVERDPKQKRFIKGWKNRIEKVKKDNY